MDKIILSLGVLIGLLLIWIIAELADIIELLKNENKE